MIILGFDYSTKNVAWGVIDNDKIGSIGYCKFSSLKDIFFVVEEILQKNQPWMIAIEGLYLQSNPKVLTSLANIQGILRLAAYRFNGCEASIITPEAAKRGIGIDVYRAPYKGSKDKEKKQMVIDRIEELFEIKLSEACDYDPRNAEHIADAIAVAWALTKETSKREINGKMESRTND